MREKPIAEDLSTALRLAETIGETSVVTQLVLSWRYAAAVRAFLEHAAGFEAIGGRGSFISAGLLGGMFAAPWRLERVALLDLGPHVIDLLDAALAPWSTCRLMAPPLAGLDCCSSTATGE